jgi:hypothetical protein
MKQKDKERTNEEGNRRVKEAGEGHNKVNKEKQCRNRN